MASNPILCYKTQRAEALGVDVLKGIVLQKMLCWAAIPFLLGGCSKPEKQAAPLPPASVINNTKAAMYNTQLGIGYLQQGDVSRAKSKLLLAKQQDPASPKVWDALGYFYEITGDKTQAEQCYLKAISLNPKQGSSLNNYGVFLCKNEHYQKSLAYFSLAVADPNYLHIAGTYENAGLCAEQVPDMKKAEQFFLLALRNNPNLPNSMLELAKINLDNGKFQVAQEYLRRYNLLAKPTSESIWLDLQLAQEQKNTQRVTSDAHLLKQDFPQSNEYKQASLSGLI